ncbi:zinc ribbon domain-containing protein [Anaerobaca lacustris]|uniref:Zinc ribbon domain-containing protein n=1 Tax=Anaerobaca lacustris TaxID=3044600 RepID=A0AAW6TS66_9BACT|nr:zinc ribbon domain-containing protein [Sedimentisphaerales bacterium M17dextr]
MDEERINPGHSGTRIVLRTIGPLIALVGLGLMVFGLVDFFRAFGGSGPPRYFWCIFLGMPLLAVGGILTKLAYLGKIFRYMAGETAPPMKDTFNYMAEGTREGVKSMASALGQGLREGGFVAGSQTTVRCHKCNALVAETAKFCRWCGQAMGKSKPCPQCAEVNDPDAKFCDNCGYKYG